MCVPLARKGEAIGVVQLSRDRAVPYSPGEIALLETFADQAVIAIENARLFAELEERNSQLTDALEQQTATGEVLRVIASAPTDLDRVLSSICEAAARLCEAIDATIFRIYLARAFMPLVFSLTSRSCVLPSSLVGAKPSAYCWCSSSATRANVDLRSSARVNSK